MQSLWLDEVDLPNHDYDGDLVLKEKIEKFQQKWIFEFDTVDNRKLMKKEFHELISSYRRDVRIDQILGDDKGK